jgi:hypothetical protein
MIYKNNSKLLNYCFILILFFSCELPNRQDQGEAKPAILRTVSADQSIPNEEYVMVTTAINMPMYVNHDQAAFKRWGEQRGVKVAILGPAEWDVPLQIETIEQVIATRPTGLLINGTDPISNKPLQFDGMALRKGQKLRLILANFQHNELTVKIPSVEGEVTLRNLYSTLLNTENWFNEFQSNRSNPESFNQNNFSVTLEPYGMVTIDVITFT